MNFGGKCEHVYTGFFCEKQKAFGKRTSLKIKVPIFSIWPGRDSPRRCRSGLGAGVSASHHHYLESIRAEWTETWVW